MVLYISISINTDMRACDCYLSWGLGGSLGRDVGVLPLEVNV